MNPEAQAPVVHSKRRGISPTMRTLNFLRERNLMVAVTEKWNPHARIRQDLFGFIDLIYAGGLDGIVGVQATDDTSVSKRLAKAMSFEPTPRPGGKKPLPPCGPRLKTWLASGGRFFVIGWGLRGARGMVKRWRPRIVWVKLKDGELVAVEQDAPATLFETR